MDAVNGPDVIIDILVRDEGHRILRLSCNATTNEVWYVIAFNFHPELGFTAIRIYGI